MEWGRVAGFALVAGASLLAGCAADSPILEQLMVVPGYYDTLSCPELIAKLRSATERVRELILLMAYNTEYAKARSTQKHAEEAAVRKRCDLSPEPGNPATGPEALKSLH